MRHLDSKIDSDTKFDSRQPDGTIVVLAQLTYALVHCVSTDSPHDESLIIPTWRFDDGKGLTPPSHQQPSSSDLALLQTRGFLEKRFLRT